MSAADENMTDNVGIEEDTEVSDIVTDTNTETDNFSELNNIISNYEDNSLKLEKDYQYNEDTDSAYKQGIIISKDDFVLDGDGHTIDGSNQAAIFNITGNNVTLKNINFINANSYFENLEGNCGAVQFKENGTVNSCNFTNNHAYIDGGGIYFHNYGNVTNCNFENNSAQYSGGAIYFKKEGTVNNSNFENNSGNNDGGAIRFQTNGNVFNSNFTSNNIGPFSYGGAIYIRNEQSLSEDTIIKNCRFINNNASSNGAFYISDNLNLKLNDCIFINNSGKFGPGTIQFEKGEIDNCIFINNTCMGEGGAIYTSALNMPVSIKNSKFINNSATNGGSIFLRGEGTLVNITIINSTAATTGGGMLLLDTTTITNCTIINSTALIAGAIYTFETSTLTNCTFQDAAALDGTIITAIDELILDNVTPEDLGPLKGIVLFVEEVTNITYGDTVKIMTNSMQADGSYLNNGAVSITINGKVYSANVIRGEATIEIPNLKAGTYTSTVSYYGGKDYGTPSQEVSFNVAKQNATITAAAKTYVINYNGKYSVTVKDTTGKAVAGETVTFTLNGKNIGSAITNSQGIATITLTSKILKTAKAGTKNLLIKTAVNCEAPSKTVKITIKKEKTKITAKKKTFKKSLKVKKYTIKLKNSKGKAVKKAKVTLKIKGKKYNAKTNAKGKATFKIKKLTKKGKYTAKINFKTTAYYLKAAKKVTIKIK